MTPTRMRPSSLLLVLLMAGSAALAEPPEVEVSPARVVLGQTAQVELELRVPEGSGAVRAAASTGTFASARLEGGTVRLFHWTPPEVRYPLVAVLAFWVEAGAESSPEVVVVHLPLLGQTTLEVSTAAGARVVVEVSGARFGPVFADAQGRARVPVEVPPGVREARVLATREALNTDRMTPLDPPESTPLLAAFSEDPLPPKDGGWLVVASNGRMDPDDVEVSATGAKVKYSEGKDSLRYRVRPAAGASRVAVTVKRKLGPESASAEARVSAAPASSAAPEAPAPAGGAESPGPRSSFFLLMGGAFTAGSGLAGSAGVTVPLPLWRERLAAEVEVGLRGASFDGRVAMGMLRSDVLGMPLLLSARGTLVESGALALHGRVGGGLLPFRHHLMSDFQEDVAETQLTGMAFLAAQGEYRMGRWSAVAEVRGAWAPARTPWLDAELGGLSATVGLRFQP